MPSLPLAENAEHKTGTWNSERDPRVVRLRDKQKNSTKHRHQHQGGTPWAAFGGHEREGWTERWKKVPKAAGQAKALEEPPEGPRRGKEEEEGEAAPHPVRGCGAGPAHPEARPGPIPAAPGPGPGPGPGPSPALLTGAGGAPAAGTRS